MKTEEQIINECCQPYGGFVKVINTCGGTLVSRIWKKAMNEYADQFRQTELMLPIASEKNVFSELDLFLKNNRVEVHFDSSQQYLCYVNWKAGGGAYGLGVTFFEALKNGYEKFKRVPGVIE